MNTVAPPCVISFIQTLQNDSKHGASVVAFVVGGIGAVWAASGAMTTVMKAVNKAYDRLETRPIWKVRLIAIVLVVLSAVVVIGVVVLIVFGGPLGLLHHHRDSPEALSRSGDTRSRTFREP